MLVILLLAVTWAAILLFGFGALACSKRADRAASDLIDRRPPDALHTPRGRVGYGEAAPTAGTRGTSTGDPAAPRRDACSPEAPRPPVEPSRIARIQAAHTTHVVRYTGDDA